MRSIGDHGDRSLIFSPKIRIENGSQSASVYFCREWQKGLCAKMIMRFGVAYVSQMT